MTVHTTIVAPEWIPELRSYLSDLYAGVFSSDAIELHIRDYIGPTFAEFACSVLKTHVRQGASVLDIGSGFGTFVLLAREAGYDAQRIEPSSFEVNFARKRLSLLRLQDDPLKTYRVGQADELKGSTVRFDAITPWNVLEHIPNTYEVLRTCHDLLSPGGKVFIISPNYLAWRDEAHYHLPWSPLDWLCRKRFDRRLQAGRRNVAYYRNSIILLANWSVLSFLLRCSFSLYDLSGNSMKFFPALSWHLTRERLRFWNPFKESLLAIAIK